MAGKNSITLEEASKINPLIGQNGDLAPVKASLQFLEKVFLQADPDDGIPLDFSESWGLSCLLKACVAAIYAHQRGEVEV